MGKGPSKNSVDVNSENPQIEILNQLVESHAQGREQHDQKITIILVIVALQLSITVYKLYKSHTKVQAIKAAKSIADIERV